MCIVNDYHPLLAFSRHTLQTRCASNRVLTTGLPFPCSLHHWSYREPFYAIDENLERADGPFVPKARGTVNRIALHHYVTKCAEAVIARPYHSVSWFPGPQGTCLLCAVCTMNPVSKKTRQRPRARGRQLTQCKGSA